METSCTITGTTGFMGQNLTSYLEDRNLKFQTINRDQLNILSYDLNSSGTIIHLAGLAHDLKKSSNPEKYDYVNYELTKKLYDQFLKSDARKFIFISSVKAVADKVEGVLNEDIAPNPATDYGKSKLKAEQYIQNQHLPSGKSFYIIRPCMTHGLGNKGNLNLLYSIISKNIPYPLAGFENKRSFLSIQNLCYVLHELTLRSDIPSGIYNVADDIPLSTPQVVTILASALDKNARLWPISPVLIRFLARIGDTLHLPLTTERLDKLTENYVVSNAKIKAAMGKQFPLSSSEGLMITAESFRSSKVAPGIAYQGTTKLA
jgi:nucleoside-diphosphate-sugar epimerase